ncbi:MAG: class I SAM-dependent methyltransferase [Syntrophaceae bacterium]
MIDKEITMEQIPDWALLWRQIVETHAAGRKREPEAGGDMWAKKARGFNASVKKRWDRQDSSRSFIIERLQADPGSTVLDIGAGTGAWACLLAPFAKKVTALEPSAAMIEVMRENLKELGITNVEIVQGAWPEAQVEDHDFSLCSHAMYGCPDIQAFFRRMHEVTRRCCILLMRVTTPDGLMAEIARHIWGQPHDSPNFHIGYNTLLQMGIYADVLMEDTGLWEPWTNDTLEEAVEEVKSKMGMAGSKSDDTYLLDLLGRKLTFKDGKYAWPLGVRSALVYWEKGY